jgi:rod shape-determining protein MreD
MMWLLPVLMLGVLVQTAVLPGWVMLGVRPDVTLVLVVAWATLRGWEEGILLGLMAGLLTDLTSAVPMGVHMFRLATVGGLVGLGMANLARTSPLIPISIAGLASIGGFLLSVLALQATGLVVPVERTFFMEALPNAVLSAGVMAIVFPLMQAFERRIHPPLEESIL